MLLAQHNIWMNLSPHMLLNELSCFFFWNQNNCFRYIGSSNQVIRFCLNWWLNGSISLRKTRNLSNNSFILQFWDNICLEYHTCVILQFGHTWYKSSKWAFISWSKNESNLLLAPSTAPTTHLHASNIKLMSLYCN